MLMSLAKKTKITGITRITGINYMGFRVTQRSFSGGELTPALIARNNLEKYENGLKILKNGFVHQEGCISNRSGLELVGEIKDSRKKARLIPFSFNTEQTYIIEAGDKYFRFIKNGGYIVHPDNTNLSGQHVEIATPYLDNELSYLKYAQNADVLTICYSHEPKELFRNSHYDWELNTIYYNPSIEPPNDLKAVWTGSTANPRNYTYLVTAVDEDTSEESNRSSVVEVMGRLESYWAVGEKVTLTFSAVPGASEYNVYRSVNGIFGFVGTTSTTTFEDDKIEPDLSATAPINKNPFHIYNPESLTYKPADRPELYPSVVNYFQQRRVFANSPAKPQTIWTTQTGTSNNFNVSSPLIASDAITLTIAEREVNEIRHLIALDDLIVLTSSAEWKINGQDDVFSASPPPIAKLQSCYGSSHVMPVVAGDRIIFVQAGGSIVRSFGYSEMSLRYDSEELSIFASHLFEGKQVIDMAFAKEPYKILWCVFSDGSLAGLTYNHNQKICGWHRHETLGKFESVAVVREGFEDIPYFIIKRTINGQDKRFVERMPTRIINNVSDSFFVDCGLRYTGEPVQTVGGLEHLEGETVIACADGGVEENLKVINGSVTLSKPAGNITVGLPYEFELETLNIEGENTFGLKKIINQIKFKIYKSREDFFVVGANGKEVQNPRDKKNIDNAELLISDDVSVCPFAKATTQATVHIKQKLPIPLTVLSITAEVSMENEQIQ